MFLLPIKMRFFALLFLVGILNSCGSTYSDSDKSEFDAKIEKYMKNKGLKLKRLDSGLYLSIEKQGTGSEKAKFTSQVKLIYTGKLLNGQVFDKTDPDKPFDSPVNGLIAGFQEALIDQTAGAQLKLIVPPNLGYGDDELDKIPANSVLVFDLEVVEVY